jgi:hypothetical protein
VFPDRDRAMMVVAGLDSSQGECGFRFFRPLSWNLLASGRGALHAGALWDDGIGGWGVM